MSDRLTQTLLDIAAEVEATEHHPGHRGAHFKQLSATPCLPRPLPLKSRPGRGFRGEIG
ncbi:MAG: hypothetical protein AMXMBFR77_00030 [Phycisphaerales bacterium]